MSNVTTREQCSSTRRREGSTGRRRGLVPVGDSLEGWGSVRISILSSWAGPSTMTAILVDDLARGRGAPGARRSLSPLAAGGSRVPGEGHGMKSGRRGRLETPSLDPGRRRPGSREIAQDWRQESRPQDRLHDRRRDPAVVGRMLNHPDPVRPQPWRGAPPRGLGGAGARSRRAR